MNKLKNWIGLCALMLSLQASGSEIHIQDAWIRMLAPGQEKAMAGMVINSTRQARIVSVISPAYMSVVMQGPGKSAESNAQELEFIDVPANKALVLSAQSMHLQLTGIRQALGDAEKIPVIFTVQFEDRSSKIVTVMIQTEHGKSVAAQASMATPVAAPRPVEIPGKAEVKAEVKAETPPPQPAHNKAHAQPVAAPKPNVAEAKPVKVAPVVVAKPAPAAVVALPAVVAPPQAPVAAVAPVIAPLAVEPKKAAEVKPAAAQPKQDEISEECYSLAVELRECSKANDMMVDWCVSNAKSRYDCQLSSEQLKKIKL